jgi:hypothetical protein
VDRQSIHIRTQSDRRAIAGSKNADDTRLADVAMDLAAKFGAAANSALISASL